MKTKQINNSNKNFISQVAYEYSMYLESFSQSFFCKKYNITPYCFRKILKIAIVELLIDDDACNRIRDKAYKNSFFYGGQSHAERCNDNYDKLFEKRIEFAKKNNLFTRVTTKRCQVRTHNIVPPLTEENLRNLIVRFQYLIDTYDDFHIEEDGAMTYNDLKLRLESYKRSLREYEKHN